MQLREWEQRDGTVGVRQDYSADDYDPASVPSWSNGPPRIGARFVQPLYRVLCGLTKPPSKNRGSAHFPEVL
jgi:hypothetical protein